MDYGIILYNKEKNMLDGLMLCDGTFHPIRDEMKGSVALFGSSGS